MGNPCREITRCRRIVAAGTGRQSIGADTSAEMKDEKREKEGKEEKRKRKKKYGKRSKVRGEGEMLSCRLRSARCFFSFSSVLSFFLCSGYMYPGRGRGVLPGYLSYYRESSRVFVYFE